MSDELRKRTPICTCGSKFIRASARVRVEGDFRPKSRIPFKSVGWYCEKCFTLQAGDWLISQKKVTSS